MLSEVEGKSIKATKDCSSVESQLQDVQVRPAHTGENWSLNAVDLWMKIA